MTGTALSSAERECARVGSMKAEMDVGFSHPMATDRSKQVIGYAKIIPYTIDSRMAAGGPPEAELRVFLPLPG